MTNFSRSDHTFTFVDTSPSELIHALNDKILVFSHINFDHLDFNEIKLKQFKETRRERKLKAQDYIIECFETRRVIGYGVIKWNTQRLALHNASTFLISSGFITPSQLLSLSRVEIAGENVSTGHLLSLAWYAILLSGCARETSIWTKRVEAKEKSLILMDLLPGDSIESSRNLNIIRFIIKNSILDGLFSDAIVDKQLQSIAFGYGAMDGSTQAQKRFAASVISDWVTQSFYCKLRCEKIIRDEVYDTNMKFSKLAEYLMEKKLFLIESPFKFED